MSAYNVLVAEITCPNCGKKSDVHIQYKYGNAAQLKYKIGDTITWGGNDIGSPALTNVKANGFGESTICPSCNEDKMPEEYDIFIKNTIITGVAPMEKDEYLAENVTYIDLNK